MKRSFVFRPALVSALLSSGALAFALGFVSSAQAEETPSTATAAQPEAPAPRTPTVQSAPAAEAAPPVTPAAPTAQAVPTAAPTATQAPQAPTTQAPTAQAPTTQAPTAQVTATQAPAPAPTPTAEAAPTHAAPAAEGTPQGSPTAEAEQAGHEGHGHADPAHAGHEGHGHVAPTTAPQTGHEGHGHEAPATAHGDHTGHHGAGDAASHGADHGGHGGHHDPHFSDINWFYGLLGEKEGAAPSLLWRPPGTPVPLAALVLNTAILFFLIIKLGGPKILAALAERKKRVASGIEAAAAMKAEAEGQLAFYEEKLQKLDQEIENIRTQMREQAEAERRRILAEAKSEREQLERDARLLVSQELKLARQELFHEAIAEAVRSAEETIKKQVSDADQQRLADDFLATVDAALRNPGRTSVESRS